MIPEPFLLFVYILKSSLTLLPAIILINLPLANCIIDGKRVNINKIYCM